VVLAGPPRARAQPLAGRGDPRLAVAVRFPVETAVPWRARGRDRALRIVHGERIDLPFRDIGREIHENRVVLPLERQNPAFVRHLVHRKVFEQVELQTAKIVRCPETEQVRPRNGPFPDVHPHVQMVIQHIVAGPGRRERPAQRIGLRKKPLSLQQLGLALRADEKAKGKKQVFQHGVWFLAF